QHGHQQEPSADAHDRSDEADDKSDPQDGDRGDINARAFEAQLEWQPMDPSMATGPAQLDRLALPGADDGAHALGYHQCADNPEERDVETPNSDMEWAVGPRLRKRPAAKGGADYPAREQHEGEGEIDRPAPPIAAGAGHGGGGVVAGDAPHRH